MARELRLAIESDGSEPVFLRIARALSGAIVSGRLVAGARLPGSRTLAQTLSVHRNTVVAAYQELVAEGWVESAEKRGTFVSRAIPDRRPRRFAPAPARHGVPPHVGYRLGPAPALVPDEPEPQPPTPHGGKVLVLSGGVPDVRLAPIDALARAYRRTLERNGRETLRYSQPYGHPRLRAALASLLAHTRGLATRPSDVLVVRGSQMAIALATRALIQPGDVVAVEALGYRPAWQVLAQAGATLTPLPVDADGLRIDALERLLARRPVRALYVTPHHHYPTTVTLTPSRRLALLALAARHRFAILEDDYDHEFHYGGRPILPLASVDTGGHVVYIGTLAKLLAPGLRLGYVVAPPAMLHAMAAHRAELDRQGDHTLEGAVAELIEDGELARHTRRAHRIYAERRDVLAACLEQALPSALAFARPEGGMALWAEVDPRLDVDVWATRAREHGVLFHPGRYYAFDGRYRSAMRLGFASLTPREIEDAVGRLARSRPPVGSRRAHRM